MLILSCFTCKHLLAHIQIPYEAQLDDICAREQNEELTSEEANELKKALVNSFKLKRYCCKMRLLTYQREIDFVK